MLIMLLVLADQDINLQKLPFFCREEAIVLSAQGLVVSRMPTKEVDLSKLLAHPESLAEVDLFPSGLKNVKVKIGILRPH